MRDALRDEPLLSFCLAPHAPYTVSDATLERVATYAAELDVPIHIHLHETLDEIDESLDAHGVRPLERLQQLGLLGPGLIAVHAVHLEPDEIDAARAPRLQRRALPVVEPEARERHRAGRDDARARRQRRPRHRRRREQQPARRARRNARSRRCSRRRERQTRRRCPRTPRCTWRRSAARGARARRRDRLARRRASARPHRGRSVAHRARAAATIPASHLVYAAGREHVTHVWVDGELRVDGRRAASTSTRASSQLKAVALEQTGFSN